MNTDHQPPAADPSTSAPASKKPRGHRPPESPAEHAQRVQETNAWIKENGIAAWYRVMNAVGGDGRDFFTRLQVL